MRGTSGRRELGFVLAVGGAGVVLVLLVVFTPWYEPPGGTAVDRADRVATAPARVGGSMH